MERNTATLEINGLKGILRLNWNWRCDYVAHEFTAPEGSGWGGVMELANRKVETYGCFVQMWQGVDNPDQTGDGTYQTALAAKPLYMD